jgi:hypothetical protein
LPLFRVAIQYGSEKTGAAALDLCWRATRSVSQIVNQALPQQPAPYFAFLGMLTARKETAPANELWQALAAQKFKFPVEEAFPYFDYLIDTQQVDQAEGVWKFLGSGSSISTSRGPRLNLITNGGFERKFLNGGFGWRDQPYSQVDVSLDTSQFHSGTSALRLKFTGPALSDTGIFQYVSVRPNTTYRFSAFGKSEDIVSASGPRLVIQDPYNNQSLGSTDDSLGTTGMATTRRRFHDQTRNAFNCCKGNASPRQSADQRHLLAGRCAASRRFDCREQSLTQMARSERPPQERAGC